MSDLIEQGKVIKVLHFIDSGGLYGAEKMLLALVSEQLKQGMRPMILSAGEPGQQEKPLEAEARELKLPIKSWRMKPGFNISESKKIVSWANVQGYTHFHSHGYKFNVLLALLSLSGIAQKMVATVHGYVGGRRFSKQWFYEGLDSLALFRFDHVVVVSQPMLSLPCIKRLTRRKVEVIANGISTEFETNTLPADIATFTERYKYNLIAVGRLSPEKGFNFLLEAMAKLPYDLREQVGLVVIGDGSLRAELVQQCHSLDLNNVLLAGYRQGVDQLLGNFDLLVMPSLTEGLPITLLESIRAKLPVCVSSVGGVPNVINVKNGVLVEAGNADELQLAIARILQDYVSSIGRAEKARQDFEDLYSSCTMELGYKKLYESA